MHLQLFVHRQNVLFFRKQLAGALTQQQRLQLLALLAEEEAKPHGPVSRGENLAENCTIRPLPFFPA